MNLHRDEALDVLAAEMRPRVWSTFRAAYDVESYARAVRGVAQMFRDRAAEIDAAWRHDVLGVALVLEATSITTAAERGEAVAS